jgi:dynein heavy chain 2
VEFIDSNSPPYINIIELQRNKFIVGQWVSNCEPFIIVGPEGSGKNLIMKSALDELKKTLKIQVVMIHCNAQTLANQII